MQYWASLLLVSTLSMTSSCAYLSRTAGPANVTGTWKTTAPAPYIIEHLPHKPQGKAVEHDHIELLERTVNIEWQLVERPDGLITGTTHWTSYGPDGKELFSGTEPLLGVHDFERLIIEEAADDAAQTPQLVFQCVFDGPDRVRVIGHEVGTKDLMVMRFVLQRQ